MVVSKRCKICTIIEADNMPIAGEYFGRPIPEIIEKISGMELDSRKLVDVLICQQCAIQLVHTESVVNKLRKSMIRLTKPATKTGKTPSKNAGATKPKDDSPTKKKKETPKPKTPTKVNGDQGPVAFKKITDESVTMNDENVNNSATKKKNKTKRKLEDSLTKAIELGTPTKSFSEATNSNGVCEESSFVEEDKKRVKRDSSSVADTSVLNETFGDVDIAEESVTKALNCVLCGKKFIQKSLLREHIETSHMGEKLKECPNCFMEFRSVQKYESHVFSEKCKGTLLPCQFLNCNRRFKNVHKMEAHMREKHLSSNDLDAE